jgi:hypothetical protein
MDEAEYAPVAEAREPPPGDPSKQRPKKAASTPPSQPEGATADDPVALSNGDGWVPL